jgi:phenylacetate-coenzyme A ligase PaaK-like adenylate-forming protein
LPFALIESIEGRSDDVVRLPGMATGSVSVPPVLFERVLEELAPAGWQVRVRDGSLEVRVVADAVPDQLVGALQHALEAVGVRADVGVRAIAVSSIEPGAAGKRPRFVVQQ